MPKHQPMERRRFILNSALATSGSILLGKTILANISSTRNMKKSVVKHTNLQFKQAFPGLKGIDMMAHAYPIEPFLVFTEFRMDQPVFGPHPHAGIGGIPSFDDHGEQIEAAICTGPFLSANLSFALSEFPTIVHS